MAFDYYCNICKYMHITMCGEFISYVSLLTQLFYSCIQANFKYQHDNCNYTMYLDHAEKTIFIF